MGENDAAQEAGNQSNKTPAPVFCKIIIYFFGFIIIIGFVILFIWLGLKGREPRSNLDRLNLNPALTTTNSSSNDTTVSFTLTLYNTRNKNTYVYYDALNFTLSYKPDTKTSNRSSDPFPVGSVLLPGLSQQGGRQDQRAASFILSGNDVGLWRKEATEVVKADGVAAFRVDLVTEIRYDLVVFWKTKRHQYNVGADVTVDGDGSLVVKESWFKWGIRLTSAGGSPEMGRWGALVRVLLVICVVSFMIGG